MSEELNKFGKIEEIYIKNIKIDDSITFRDRWGDNKEDGALLMSISNVGLITPIVIRPINNNDGKYSLVEGYRRLTAMKKLGYKQISCKIVELSNSEAMGVFLSAHLGCKELSYEQIKRQTNLLRDITNDKRKERTLNDDEFNRLKEFANNIEKNNPSPPPPTTHPYYCSKCKRTHIRGEIYKKHDYYKDKEFKENE